MNTMNIQSQFTNRCNPAELLENLTLNIRYGNPVLVKGRLGSGKSALAVEAARKLNFSHHSILVDDPHLKEVADYVGLPFLDRENGSAQFKPIGIMEQIVNATQPTLVIFDEIDKAFRPTANAVAQIIHGRCVNQFKIPDCVRFVATCNLPDEETGSLGIPTHLLDRYFTILELQQDENVWAAYMIRKYGTSVLPFVQFVRFRPEFLLKGQDTQLALALEKTPTARSLENFYRILEQIQQFKNVSLEEAVHDSTFQKTLIGACGSVFFLEFVAFLAIYKEIPTMKQIVSNPQKAPIPTEQGKIGHRHAIIGMLVKNMDSINANAICEYLKRPEWNPYRSLRAVFVETLKQTETYSSSSPHIAAQLLELICA